MKKYVAGVLVLASVLGFCAFGSTASAQTMTLAQLIELFITLGIIPPDKVVTARAAVGLTAPIVTGPSVSLSGTPSITKSTSFYGNGNGTTTVTAVFNVKIKAEGSDYSFDKSYLSPFVFSVYKNGTQINSALLPYFATSFSIPSSGVVSGTGNVAFRLQQNNEVTLPVTLSLLPNGSAAYAVSFDSVRSTDASGTTRTKELHAANSTQGWITSTVYVEGGYVPPARSSASVSISGQPTLSLEYDSARKESQLSSVFEATVTAGSSDLKLFTGFAGAYFVDQNDKVFNLNSSRVRIAVPAGEKNDVYGRNYTIVAAGKSMAIKVYVTADPKHLFAGAYRVALDSFYTVDPANEGGSLNLAVTKTFTNSKTVIGELSPYITSVTQTVAVGQTVTIQGQRLQGGIILIDGATPSDLAYKDGNGSSLSFTVPSSVSAGRHFLTVNNTTAGLSNGLYFDVTGSVTSPDMGTLSLRNLADMSSSVQINAGNVLSTVIPLEATAQGSAMTLQRVKIMFDSRDLWLKVFKTFYLTDESGTVYSQADLNTSTVVYDGSGYFLTLGGFNYKVSKDSSRKFYIKADAYTAIDAVYARKYLLAITTDALRAQNEAGIDKYAPSSDLYRYVSVVGSPVAYASIENVSVSNKVLTKGSSYSISWTEKNVTQPVNIYLQELNTTLMQWTKVLTIGTYSPSSSGSRTATWSVPSDLITKANTRYMIYVETIGSGGMYDVSFALPVTSACADSDGGINLDAAGLTDGRVNDLGSYFKDSSVGTNGGQCTGTACTGVAEGYCEGGKVANRVYQCPSGYSVAGACAQKVPAKASVVINSLSPVGGESYKAGDTVTIKWDVTGLATSNNSIGLAVYRKSTGSTKSLISQTVGNPVVDGKVSSARSYSWQIPASAPEGTDYVVYLSTVEGWRESGSFSIAGAVITPVATTTPAVTGSNSVTPSSKAIRSGETVTLNYTSTSNAVSAKLYLVCPAGVTSSFGTSAVDRCNTWYTFPMIPSSDEFKLYNASAQSQNVIPNFYIYNSEKPDFANGVTTQINVASASSTTQGASVFFGITDLAKRFIESIR